MDAEWPHKPNLSVSSLRTANSRGRIPLAVYGGAAIVAVVVGVLSLVHTSPARRMIESWSSIHVLFGLLFSGLMLARNGVTSRFGGSRTPRPDNRLISLAPETPHFCVRCVAQPA
jgi:hypothetical protein